MALRPLGLSNLRLVWRDATRALASTPAVTLLAIATLTLGLGSAVAILSIVNGVLLKPLPYDQPDRVVVVWESRLESHGEPNVVSPGNYLAWREQNQVFQQMAALGFPTTSTMTGRGPATRVPVRLMSRELPELLGIRMAFGRPFTAEEDRPRSGVAIISHRAWVQRFNSNPAVVGHTVTIDGEPRRIVGVMSAGVTILDQQTDIWLPTGFDESARTPRGRWITVVARLKPGVSVEQAQSNMTVVAARLTKQWPEFDTNWTARVIRIDDELVGGARQALLLLALAAAVLLTIACANVAGLMLARATARARDLAVRTALGAGHGHLSLHILAESALVSLAGGIGGAFVAFALVRSVVILVGDTKAVPRLGEVGLDGVAVIVSLALTALTTLAVGIAPALKTIRQDVVSVLAMGSRSNTAHGCGSPCQPKPPVGNEPVADIRIIAGDYCRALEIPLRAGRFFGPQDGPESRVIIVDEAMARESWPAQDPIGRQVKVIWNDDNPQTVIGVVGDIRPARLDHAGRATIYLPLTYDTRSTMGMVGRAAADAAARAVRGDGARTCRRRTFRARLVHRDVEKA